VNPGRDFGRQVFRLQSIEGAGILEILHFGHVRTLRVDCMFGRSCVGRLRVCPGRLCVLACLCG
jgi:hypothetical protein